MIPAVAIDGVRKSFAGTGGDLLALDDVSLDVAPGEFVSLIGPSGCGKSTLLNLVAGLARPDRGRVAFAGDAVSGPNTRVGYMTQDDALLPWRNVLDNVALALEIRRVPRPERIERAREMLRLVNLSGFERHLPSQLSGGMRKRVGLARTLIHRPGMLLLDEPFGALDAQTRTLIQREFKRLVVGLGLGVMLVTHDLREAAALSDRIVVFSARPARIVDDIAVPAGRSPADLEAIERLMWRHLGGDDV